MWRGSPAPIFRPQISTRGEWLRLRSQRGRVRPLTRSRSAQARRRQESDAAEPRLVVGGAVGGAVLILATGRVPVGAGCAGAWRKESQSGRFALTPRKT